MRERIVVGADDAVVLGDGLKDVVKIGALGKELTSLFPATNGKSLRVTGLADAGITTIARTVDCELVTKDGERPIQLEIVNSKVESIPKQ